MEGENEEEEKGEKDKGERRKIRKKKKKRKRKRERIDGKGEVRSPTWRSGLLGSVEEKKGKKEKKR